jgi:hypothetical protein
MWLVMVSVATRVAGKGGVGARKNAKNAKDREHLLNY